MEKILEYSLADIVRIIGSATLVYIIIIIYIRLMGKRSMSQLNNFDWIVTVSIGSILASTVILEDVTVPEGALSVLILMILQFAATKFMYYSEHFREVVKATPQLLLFEGELIEENMRKERILKPEVYAAIRRNGYKSVKQIYAVVLESNSEISVIPNKKSEEIGFSLSDVQGLPDGLKEDLKNKEDSFHTDNIKNN